MATRNREHRRRSIWNRNISGLRFPDKEPSYDPYSRQSSHYSTPRTYTISQAEARSRAQALASPSRDDGELPDIVIFKNLNETWSFEYPAFCIDDGRLHISDIRRLAGETLHIANTSRIKLMYKGRLLDEDDASAKAEGLKQFSEVVGVVVSGYAGNVFGDAGGVNRMDGYSTSSNGQAWREPQLIPVSDSEEEEEKEEEEEIYRPSVRRGRSPPKTSHPERRKSVRRERKPRDPSPCSPDRSPPLSREATSPREPISPRERPYPTEPIYPVGATSPRQTYPGGVTYPGVTPPRTYPKEPAYPTGATSPRTQYPSPPTYPPPSTYPSPSYAPQPYTPPTYPSPSHSSFDPLPNISRQPRPYATSHPSPSVSSTVSASTSTSESTSASASTSTSTSASTPTSRTRSNTTYTVPNRPPTPCPPFLATHSPSQMLSIFETHVNDKLIPLCAQYMLDPPPDPRLRIKEQKRLSEAMERILARADEITVGSVGPLRARRKRVVQLVQRYQGKVDAMVGNDEGR
ncbi:hypothetical protein FQN49_004306 [Arthroderma sp. PD_2]|nr:hypothetical protein FQN49_004306 [Arthroderma sp. PD_2]